MLVHEWATLNVSLTAACVAALLSVSLVFTTHKTLACFIFNYTQPPICYTIK